MTGNHLNVVITGIQGKATSYQIDEGLKRFVKAGAALEDCSQSEFVETLVLEGLARRVYTFEVENDASDELKARVKRIVDATKE